MQENLQNFNYEVFVSKTMLDMLLYSDDPWDSSFYQLIILSESLSNRELKLLVPKLKKKNAVIFRKYLCEPINKEKGVLEELGIDQWIPREIGTDVLRELISECTVPVIEEVKEKQHTETIEEIVMDLTKNQNKCFSKLYEAQASIVSREELCKYIWDDEPTRSNLAQLSVLTKSLRQKLMRKGFSSTIIETVWGKGYHLNKEFYTVYHTPYQ
ncbi:helix-turn-helix domain-containing protein [Enterococcus hulanensis]|uniref:helix-turn-helix domain-containing protein n=1 Tax=Enterococcus hulanensis TaxID=2559929 RepID=UPI001A8C74C8|nr:helix-turn-helix domain-containing protein [Enterococcus hulanensis]MBO0458100.1 helix-turn-helix domain-containing protein [Enterococcus hulanensis]